MQERLGSGDYWDWFTVHENMFKINLSLKKNLEKSIFNDLTAIKTNSFQRKSIKTLSYASIGGKVYLFVMHR